MQNNKSVSDQTRPPTADISAGSKRRAIIIAIIVLIISVGYFVYLLGQITARNAFQSNRNISIQLTPIPKYGTRILTFLTPTTFVPKTVFSVPTTDPMLTANWKTYMNEKYGFSFQYPQRFYINTPPCPQDYSCITDPENRYFETYQRPPGVSYDDLLPTLEYEVNGGGGYLHLYVENTELYPSAIFTKIESIAVEGKTGKIFIGDYHIPAPNNIDNIIRAIDIPLNGKHVQLIYLKGDKAPTLDEFNQILSTFKFS